MKSRASIPLDNKQSQDVFGESFDGSEELFKQTFNSNKLNFEEDKSDIENQEMMSPMFTKGFESFKKKLGNFSISDEDRQEFLNDFRDKLSKETPDMFLSKFSDVWNQSMHALKKKASPDR